MLWDILENVTGRTRRFWKWIKRNKKGMALVIFLGSTVYVLYKALSYKLYLMQMKDNKREISQMRLQAYFNKAQKRCDNTVLSFMSPLSNKLNDLVNLPSATQLRNSLNSATKEEKKL